MSKIGRFLQNYFDIWVGGGFDSFKIYTVLAE